MENVHATCVEIAGIGILLRGPEGSGKSDLALRLIDDGARLVADDRVEIHVAPHGPIARAPGAIAGRIEVRGIGILSTPHIDAAPVRLVFDLISQADALERLPEPDRVEIGGVPVPRYRLHPFEPSAAAKVRWTARSCARGIINGNDEARA